MRHSKSAMSQSTVGEVNSVNEFTVHTRLFSSEYEKVLNQDGNSELVATNMLKKRVYFVAKHTQAVLNKTHYYLRSLLPLFL